MELKDQILIITTSMARLKQLESEAAIDVREKVSTDCSELKNLKGVVEALDKLFTEIQIIANMSKLKEMIQDVTRKNMEMDILATKIESDRKSLGV